MLALASPLDAVHLMKTVRLQTVMEMLATAVLIAIYMEIVAVILSTYAQRVRENM